jgi:hypothetical protein
MAVSGNFLRRDALQLGYRILSRLFLNDSFSAFHFSYAFLIKILSLFLGCLFGFLLYLRLTWIFYSKVVVVVVLEAAVAVSEAEIVAALEVVAEAASEVVAEAASEIVAAVEVAAEASEIAAVVEAVAAVLVIVAVAVVYVSFELIHLMGLFKIAGTRRDCLLRSLSASLLVLTGVVIHLLSAAVLVIVVAEAVEVAAVVVAAAEAPRSSSRSTDTRAFSLLAVRRICW